MKRVLTLLLILAGSQFARATVTVNATLTTPTGPANFAFLQFDLKNCGYNIPVVPNVPSAMVVKSIRFTPAQLPAAIYGDDEITCGNIHSTLWHVTAYADANTPIAGDYDYAICSGTSVAYCPNPASSTWNLATAQPFSGNPPAPGWNNLYGNPTQNQNWNQPAGTQANMNGEFLFSDGIFAGTVTFSQLSSLTGMSNFVYVSDASPSSSPCTGGGSGAFAFYVNGAWTCAIGGGGGGTGTVTSVTGTANQIAVSNSSTTPAISIVPNPTLPGNVIVTGTLNINGASFAVFAQTFTGTVGNSGKIAQTGAVSGTALSCFDASGNVTNVGCPAISPTAPGVATELPFRNASSGLLAADSSLFYTLLSHTLTVTNINVNGIMTWLNSFGFTSTIPISSACTPTVGMTSVGIDTAGALAQSVNGAACNEFSVLAGLALVTTPLVTQNAVQPLGTSLNVNIFSNIRYVTPSYNFLYTLAVDWSATGAKTATLTPCPLGIDVSNNTNQFYRVYLPTTNPEVVTVTGGTCTSGGASGTVTFTTALAHSASSNVIQSAYAGYQEAINDACGTATGAAVSNPNCVVRGMPTGAIANAPIIRAPVFIHASNVTLDLNGVIPNCATRDRCFFMGDLSSSNHYSNVKILGGSFESSVNADGCLITNTQRISNVVTITVTGCSSILTGDTVNINFTDNTNYWGNKGPVTVSGSTVTYAQTGADIPSAATPGTIAPLVAIIEDNALPGTIDGANIAAGVSGGKFNQGFVIDNDQAAAIDHTTNKGTSGLRCTPNHCASVIFTAGTSAATPVIWVTRANWDLQCGGNGLTNYANNTVHIIDSVIQGFAQWGVYTGNILGSFGGTSLDNIYNEEGLGPCTQPYNFAAVQSSFASAGVMYLSGGQPLLIRGGEQPNGNSPRLFVPTGGTQLNYYVVPHDSVYGYGWPLIAGYGFTNGTGTPVIQWSRIPASSASATMTYDILRWGAMGNISSNTPAFPTTAVCTGGTPTACGSIALAQAQCAALVCTFTDNVASNTTSYAIPTTLFYPLLPFWPGGLILHSVDPTNIANVPTAQMDTDEGSANFSAWISVAGRSRPTIFVRQCLVSSQGPQGMSGGAFVQCLDGDSHQAGNPGVGALLLQNGTANGAGTAANVKGRLNFIYSGQTGSYSPQHLITLVDSNAAKTLATNYFRPPNDALDAYIGIDTGTTCLPNACPISIGSPLSISSYIGNIGDGSAWLERLTASLKTFTVPITTNSQISSTLATGTAPLVIASTTRVSNLYTSGNPGLFYCGTTGTCVLTRLVNGFAVFGKATLSGGTLAYSGLPFASTTWLCNTWDVTTPGTTSSMVQVTDSTHATITGTGTDVIGFHCDGN